MAKAATAHGRRCNVRRPAAASFRPPAPLQRWCVTAVAETNVEYPWRVCGGGSENHGKNQKICNFSHFSALVNKKMTKK
ncbi:MAG: hypothetical protein DRH20_09395 [Deltaproteobacteria bacterium]|nr:MAG: hypothetical protein DRH20_09395 [Deltaproteobacteria bacterium]